MIRYILMSAALCLAWAGAGEGENFQGMPVADISFSPPAQPIPPPRLQELIPLQAGKPLDATDIEHAIRALFVTGRYADIQVDAVRVGDGVKVTFITVENWFVGSVKVLDVKEPPSAGQLANATKLQLGELYSEEKISAAKESLLRLLAENGFFQATLGVETAARSDTQQIDIVFRVEPGRRAHFGEIRLAGKPDLTPLELRNITGWQEDRLFTQPALQAGLERVRRRYQKRSYLRTAIRVAGQRYLPGPNRVDLDLEINPGPRTEVVLSGASLSPKKLRSYLPIFQEGTIDRDLVAEGAENLRDYFQSQGFFEAKLDYDLGPEESGRILIEYQAVLGKRHNFATLEVSGNHFFDLATMRERMYLQPSGVQVRHGRFSQSLLRSDIQTIEELYRSNGFQAVKVRSRTEDDYQGREGDVAVFLSIEEGPQTLISQLKVAGNRSIPAKSFADKLSSIEGQPFSENNVASDRDEILSTYFQAGFPDATLEWRSKPGSQPNTVELEYAIKEGERQFVNQVFVGGYENTRPAVVRRQITVYSGDPLSQTAMLETQRRLYNLGIFSKVDMAVQNPEGQEEYRNVLFQVEEARRWTVGLGGGAEIARFGGSDTNLDSPAGATGFSPRVTLDVSRLNLLGTSNTLSFRSRFSTLQKRGLLSYDQPQWRGRERLTLTFISLYDTSRNVRTFTAQRLEGALQLQHKVSKPSSLFYRYSYRRVSVDEGTLKITPGLIPLLSQPVRVGLLSA
ncbi:MAG: hypothetical protein HY236_07690, partial [Acidobacteria bacterium]|nr:hypothetical protein [Acidobacteriota bacterium]